MRPQPELLVDCPVSCLNEFKTILVSYTMALSGHVKEVRCAILLSSLGRLISHVRADTRWLFPAIFREARKLQALVYDILPSTTAVFSYAIGSRKLSANEQFFVGAQTVVSLLQTTQIKQGVSSVYSRQQSLHQHK